MKIVSTEARPTVLNAPKLVNPVLVTLDIPIYQATESGIVRNTQPIYCERNLAETVLLVAETLLPNFVHVDIFKSHYAYRDNDTLITPLRWSDHAYGLAIDFKGTFDSDNIKSFRDYPVFIEASKAAIEAEQLEAQIYFENTWIHLGIKNETE